MAKKLQELGIEIASIHLIGSLKQHAENKFLKDYLLDESWYNQQHDFELELEVTEAESGKQAFQTLMADLNIPITLAPNKIQRMMRTTALSIRSTDVLAPVFEKAWHWRKYEWLKFICSSIL